MKMTMGRRAYPSDLTDEQWEILEPLIPKPSQEGRVAFIERREIVNAILYVLRSGCPWRQLPHDLPAWQTVYWYFQRWEREGIWKQIWQELHRLIRMLAGRDPDPCVGILDSQTVKTGPVRGSEKGYDWVKKIWGRKRHLLVDSMGWPMAILVEAAQWLDPLGAERLLRQVVGHVPRLASIWADAAYHQQGFLSWVQNLFRVRVLRTQEIPPHYAPPQLQRHATGKFQKVPRLMKGKLGQRWVVEPSFAWISRLRRLARDVEGKPASSEAFIALAFSRLMLQRLAPGSS